MSFAKIRGQDNALSFLKASLKNNRLSHAYIFCGPEGSGKFLAALNFAKAIMCQNALSCEPCDKCPSCKKIDAKSHPDLFVLRPEKEGGSVKIDDIRQLIKDIYLKPFEAKKKVYIIDEAQSMKHEAANALLKTLEEPPTDSMLILITDNLKSLFHTIVSRSQVVRFYPLKADVIKDILIKEHALEEYKAHVLSKLASGRLGEAVKYKDDNLFQNRSLIINKVSKRSLSELSFDELPKQDLKLCLNIMLTWFRDILSAKAGVDDSMLVNIDKKDMISSEAGKLSFKYLEDIINSIILTLGYLDQNANAKLAMNVLNLKICEV
ncbi:MAG: DNA polymerase III subunit delta' [Candidatus Omnitrophota bacterium]|jgi:DNA polymerase-3 subunit delta'